MRISCLFSSALLFLLFYFQAAGVQAQFGTAGLVFTVSSAADSVDAAAGDGVCADANGACTLRAAVMEANVHAGTDVIVFALPAPAVIDLTLGKILITSNTAIVGPGARRLTVQRSLAAGTPNFRIFEIPDNSTITLTMRGLKISNGNAGNSNQGAALYIARGATANLTDIVMSNNTAVVGAAISNVGTLNLTRALLYSNNAGSQGGAIMNIDGLAVARITNSTITDNFAVTGGAIYNSGSLLLVNNTIFHNSATNLGSSVVNTPGGTINILNTIMAGDSTLPVTALQGAFNSLGNNIVSDARTSTGFTNGTNNDQVANNNLIDPALGSLADNGGQTDTRIPLPGSSAINTGNSCVKTATCSISGNPTLRLTSDQRTNFNRNVGGAVDIGAFETGAAPATGTTSFSGALSHPVTGYYAHSVLIMSSAFSGDKKYLVARPFPIYAFQGLVIGDVYVLEIRSKRPGFFPPTVIALDNF